MIEGKPSRTALMTAVQRAYHYLTAPEPKILRDDLALPLTGLRSADVLKRHIEEIVTQFTDLSDAQTAQKFMDRITSAVCMRSRVVEEKLEESEVEQLVILGAGLDTLAYRLPELTSSLDVFEVDHPSTQQWKKTQLAKANIAIPNNLKFVAFDFENQTLADALEAGGVNPGKVTFFTWLGVHMYLTDEAVRATLNVMGSFAAGSEMVMDFIEPNYQGLEGAVSESVDHLTKVVLKMGEPMKSQYHQPELLSRLNKAGFNHVDFLTARWLIDNYMDGQDAAYEMPNEATSILWAKKG